MRVLAKVPFCVDLCLKVLVTYIAKLQNKKRVGTLKMRLLKAS